MNGNPIEPTPQQSEIQRAVAAVLPPAHILDHVEQLTPGESRKITEKLRKMVKVAKKSVKPPELLASEMINRVEHGRLWPLRCDPNPECQDCGGGGKFPHSKDGKHRPCVCCSEGWCRVHDNPMEEEEKACDHGGRGGGILLPCRFIKLV